MKKNWPVVVSGSFLFLLIVILTLDSHFRSERALVERYSQTQSLLVQEIANRLQAHLNHYAQVLRILGNSTELNRWPYAHPRDFLQQLLTAVEDPRIEAFTLYDTTGRIVASTREAAIGRVYAQCDFFLWAKENPQRGQVFITALVPNPAMTKEGFREDSTDTAHIPFHVLMATPIADSQGNFAGVLTLLLGLDDLLQGEFAGKTVSSTDLGIWLIAKDGTLIYQSQHPEMELYNIYDRDSTCLDCHVSFDYVESVLRNSAGTVFYQLRDKPKKMAAYASVSLENIDWRVVVNIPMATISAIASQNLRRVMASIFFTAFLFLLGAYLLYRNYRLKVRVEEEARQHREKQKLLDQLRDSEELYRTIVDTAHDMIWTLNREGQFTFINQRAEEVTGYPVKEWIGQSFEPLIHPDDLPKVRKVFQETLEGKSQSYETRVIAPDGRVFHFSVHTAPLYRRGEIVGTISFGRDVTREKEAEHALLRRETILEAMRYGAETFLRIPDVNQSIPEFLKHLGQAAEVERLCVYENFRTPDGKVCARQAYEWLCKEIQSMGEKPFPSPLCYEEDGLEEWRETLQSGQPLLLSYQECPESLKKALQQTRLRWLLIFPIFVDQAWWGFLSFGRHREEPWSPVEKDALQTAADMIGSAFERWELEQEAAGLARVLTHLNTARTIREAFPLIADAVRATCACSHVLLAEFKGETRIQVVDLSDPALKVLCEGSIPKPDLVEALGTPAGPGFWLFPDVQNVPQTLQCLFPSDVHSAAVYPLQAGTEWLGMLLLGWPYTEGYHVPKIRRLTQLTQALSMAWQRSLLMERAEEEARRLHRIITSVRAGILVLDREHRIVLANPLAEEYLQVLAPKAEKGKPLETLAGVSLDILLKPPPFGVPYHELTLRKPSPRIFQINAYSLRGEEWVLLIRDVTREREIQERARQQDRLAAVGQLAAGIAHDFNNILTTVIGIGELLALREDLPQDVRRDLQMVVEQGERAARLIRQVLDFSRKSVAEKQPLDLLSFMKESVRWLQRTFPETIQIELDWESGDYWLYGDPAQLQQVLTNLALNSRDAMPNGGTIRIHLSRIDVAEEETPPHPEVPPGKWIVISFSDTGTGIPPEILPRIFEPFFTTKKSGVGTGLGLAQVHGIVKQHDGYIFVESEVGKGTTFTIYFPALLTKADIEKIEQRTPLPKGQGEWILVVEDDAAVRYLAKSMLTHLGYQVHLAKNGREALQIYEDHRDDIKLVITDLLMPEMDGRALIQELKARDPSLPIIIMTGYPRDPQALELLTKGEIPWIQKPLQLTLLARIVHEALHPLGSKGKAA